MGGFVLLGALYLLFYPVPFEPVAYTPSPNPGRTGDFAPNESLSGMEHLIAGAGIGPEDVAEGHDGLFYAGFQDGRIVRFHPEWMKNAETFVNTGGRPLGMQFDDRSHLIVADGVKGLLSISPDGTITVLTNSVDGAAMRFVDDLDIASDGTIWFSDASQRFGLEHYILDFWEAEATGRLLTYDPQSKDTTVQVENLHFANGVALGPDDAYVLVNETRAARITRLWLKGPESGVVDTFLENLPAYPDNLSFSEEGLFWVALVGPRDGGIESLWPHPFLRKVVFRLPGDLFGAESSVSIGWVVGVDTEGKIRYNLQDPTGAFPSITSVNEYLDHLYLGSIATDSVGRIPSPASITH